MRRQRPQQLEEGEGEGEGGDRGEVGVRNGGNSGGIHRGGDASQPAQEDESGQ